MILDTNLALGPGDRPRRLVCVRRAGISSELGARIIPAAIDDLRALHDASVEAGAEVAVRTAYPSYAQQATVFSHWVAVVRRAARAHRQRATGPLRASAGIGPRLRRSR